MKHRSPGRPIGKCKGCCLNLRTACAAGLEPKVQWDRHRCKFYNDEQLLAKAQDAPPPTGTKLARLQRKARAQEASSAPHYNGVLDPGKMAGRLKRRSAAPFV